MTDLAATIRIQTIEGLIAKKQNVPGALLPLLHDIQDTVGYVPADSLVLIAQALNLSRAEVHGVVTFYHHFKAEPSGRQVVQLCRAEACKSMGADVLWSHACAQLQVSEKDAQHGITTTDQRFSLLPVYCLGLCSTAPAMALDDRVHGRVQCSDFDRLVAAAGSVV